jgi:hypothetical protein
MNYLDRGCDYMKFLKMLGYIGCIAFLLNDFITLLKGATFTPIGLATFLFVMVIGCELENNLRKN